MKNTTVIVLIAAAFAASVPSGFEANAQPQHGRGVWEVPAYGYVLAETEATLTIYGRSGTFCDLIMQVPAGFAATEFGTRTDIQLVWQGLENVTLLGRTLAAPSSELPVSEDVGARHCHRGEPGQRQSLQPGRRVRAVRQGRSGPRPVNLPPFRGL